MSCTPPERVEPSDMGMLREEYISLVVPPHWRSQISEDLQ